mgnify:CR=1 FL=1|jgi:hypothetical protein
MGLSLGINDKYTIMRNDRKPSKQGIVKELTPFQMYRKHFSRGLSNFFLTHDIQWGIFDKYTQVEVVEYLSELKGWRAMFRSQINNYYYNKNG